MKRGVSGCLIIIILLGVGVCCFVLFIYVDLDDLLQINETSSIEYRVTMKDYSSRFWQRGDNEYLSASYRNQSGNTEEKDVGMRKDNPTWSYEFTAKPGQGLHISVSSGGDYASFMCEIVIEGVIVERAESAGEYKRAACSRFAERVYSVVTPTSTPIQ